MPADRPTALCIAGFGDTASMFAPLLDTPLAAACRLAPIDLPGFGAMPPLPRTTLDTLAAAVRRRAEQAGATIIVAHSVASIIASLVARDAAGPVDTVISLEGNLTAADAYFSGTAADHPDPQAFRSAFLARLQRGADADPILARYRAIVADADPDALWQLGCDARRFSNDHVPGEVLMQAPRAVYLYNPENCRDETLDWLDRHPLPRHRLDGASHWPTLDRPDQTAEAIHDALLKLAPATRPVNQ